VVLGIGTAEAFVFLKIQPFKRDQVYDKVRRLNASRVFRVTGEIDLIAQVPQSRLDTFLEKSPTSTASSRPPPTSSSPLSSEMLNIMRRKTRKYL